MYGAIRFQLSLKAILHARLPFLEKIQEVCFLFRGGPGGNWPSFVYLLSGLVNPVSFSIFRTRMYVNFIFYVSLVLSTYFLGKKCFNRRVGLIAAFLISFYPAIYAYSRQFGLDFPLASMAAVCTCLLVYSENFSKRDYSLLFGLSLGMATLVKLQIMFFVCAPLIYSIFKIFYKENKSPLKSFLNLFFSLAVAYLLFSLYWGDKLKFILMNFFQQAFSLYPFYKGETSYILESTKSMAPSIFSIENIAFYPRWAAWFISFWLFGLFVIALLAFLIKKNKWKAFFLLNLLVPYLILTLISVKGPRYALPILIPLSIISACFIDRLRFRYFKMVILGGVIFYCVGFNLSSSWWTDRCYYPLLYAPAYSHPPNPNDLLEVLKKKGIISRIEKRLQIDNVIVIRHLGANSLNTVVPLYSYFQNDIFNKKLNIERLVNFDPSSLNDVDYIIAQVYRENADFISSENGLLPKEVLLKNYKVLSKIEESIFLERK
jgi:hypothetical protein